MQQHSDHCNSSWCFAVRAGTVPKVQLPLCPTPQHPSGDRNPQVPGREGEKHSSGSDLAGVTHRTARQNPDLLTWKPKSCYETITFNFSLDKYVIWHFCNVKNWQKTMGCKASMGKLLPFLLLHAWGMCVISSWSRCASLDRVSF